MFFISYLATSLIFLDHLQVFIKIKNTDKGPQMIMVDGNILPNNKSNKEHH